MPTPVDPKELALTVAHLCDERKGEDIKVLDVQNSLAIADYFVLATGRNRRHLRAMADEARKTARERGWRFPKEEDGGEAGRWILLDFGDVVVHLLDTDMRTFYDLDGLWADAPMIPRPAESA